MWSQEFSGEVHRSNNDTVSVSHDSDLIASAGDLKQVLDSGVLSEANQIQPQTTNVVENNVKLPSSRVDGLSTESCSAVSSIPVSSTSSSYCCCTVTDNESSLVSVMQNGCPESRVFTTSVSLKQKGSPDSGIYAKSVSDSFVTVQSSAADCRCTSSGYESEASELRSSYYTKLSEWNAGERQSMSRVEHTQSAVSAGVLGYRERQSLTSFGIPSLDDGCFTHLSNDDSSRSSLGDVRSSIMSASSGEDEMNRTVIGADEVILSTETLHTVPHRAVETSDQVGKRPVSMEHACILEPSNNKLQLAGHNLISEVNNAASVETSSLTSDDGCSNGGNSRTPLIDRTDLSSDIDGSVLESTCEISDDRKPSPVTDMEELDNDVIMRMQTNAVWDAVDLQERDVPSRCLQEATYDDGLSEKSSNAGVTFHSSNEQCDSVHSEVTVGNTCVEEALVKTNVARYDVCRPSNNSDSQHRGRQRFALCLLLFSLPTCSDGRTGRWFLKQIIMLFCGVTIS